MSLLRFGSCLLYGLVSNCMVMGNRYLVGEKYYAFTAQAVVLLFQNSVALSILVCSKQNQWIDFNTWDGYRIRRWIPMTLCYVLMLYTNTKATVDIPLHLIVVFKNIANLGIVMGEWRCFHRPVSFLTLVSLFCMFVGALMASYSDVQTSQRNWRGNGWLMGNSLATMCYVLYLRQMTSKEGWNVSPLGIVYYNNLLSILVLFPLVVVTGEVQHAISNPLWWDLSFDLLILLTSLLGLLLQLSSSWCIRLTSATTFAMVGALNKLPMTIMGIVILQEPVDRFTLLYDAFGLMGGLLYAYAKYQEQWTKGSPAVTT